MQKRAFIIHGWEGSPDIHWFPWLKENLVKKGFTVSAPQMPDTMNPKMDAWVNKLSEEVGKPDKDCYFIGHSLGCITILRYLETLKPSERAGGVVMVAGFPERINYDELNNFFLKPIEWESIASRCKNFVAIFSDNDPYVPLKYADTFKTKLNAEIVVEHNKGHFNADEGVTKLPIALEKVLEISEK